MLSVANKSSAIVENLSISKLVERRALRNSRAVVLESPGCVGLTYGELQNQINDVVDTLNRMGIGRKDRVALIVPSGPEMALAFIAVASAATCAPLNPGLTESEFEFFLSELRPKALIIHSGQNSSGRSVAKRLGIAVCVLSPTINSAAGLFELACDAGIAVAGSHSYGLAQSDDVALILHTSGTTAKPKMVSLTHANICTSAENIHSTFWLNEDDRCLNVMPLFHVHGLIGALLSSLAAGGAVISSRTFDPAMFFRLMQEFRPTWYTAVPTIHQAVLRHAPANREIVRHNRFRFIRSCSAPLPMNVMNDLEHEFRTAVIESYGMTEASHQITSNPLPPYERKPGSVGKAAGPEVSIMDESGNLLPHRQTGEIVVRGETVISSYTETPGADASSFSGTWFRTGDQGFIDEDGYLFINGRIKELINRGGYKIAPREIEETLLDHPSVEQAIAFAAPHPTLGEDAYAAVVLHQRSVVTERALEQFIQTRMTISKMPRRILIVPEIPKGATGKPQRRAMAEKLGITIRKERFVPPQTRLECEVAEVWRNVLNLNSLGVTDNFFELGGDSLKAAEVVRRLEQKFEIEIPAHLLLQANTITALVRIVSGAHPANQSEALIPLQPHGSKAPFFLVSSLGWEPFAWRNLPHHLDPEQPVYILKSIGLNGNVPPHDRIEAMAAHNIDELRTVNPDGPYLIGGYSSGGVVAFEMAQQLRLQRKEVALLLLIDTRLSQNHPFITGSRRAGSKLSRLAETVDDCMGFILELHSENRLNHLSELFRSKISNVFDRQRESPQNRIQRTVFDANQRAVHNYMPKSYPGRLTFFMCSGDYARSSRDSRLAWSRVAADSLDLHVLPGSHLDVLESVSLKIVAERLTSVINRMP